MRFSWQDYPTIANLLLIPVQYVLVRALPGMGLSGEFGTGQQALFLVLVGSGLMLEFPAMTLHAQLARVQGAPSGFSRLVWLLTIFRVILLLVLGVLALDAVGVDMNHWIVQLFMPIYGLIYVFFCLLIAGRVRGDCPPSALPPMRSLVIGAIAAFWNLALMTSLWNVLEAELSVSQPLPQARTVVIVAMSLLAFMLYVPARLPYLLVEQAGIGQGLRRLLWYAVFVANIVTPIVAAYTR